MSRVIKYPSSVIIWYKMVKSNLRMITFFVIFSGVCLGISCVYEVFSTMPSIHEIDRLDYTYLAIRALISLIPRYMGMSAMLAITLTIGVMLLNIKKLNAYVRDEKKRGFPRTRLVDQSKFGRPKLL